MAQTKRVITLQIDGREGHYDEVQSSDRLHGIDWAGSLAAGLPTGRWNVVLESSSPECALLSDSEPGTLRSVVCGFGEPAPMGPAERLVCLKIESDKIVYLIGPTTLFPERAGGCHS